MAIGAALIRDEDEVSSWLPIISGFESMLRQCPTPKEV